MALILAEPRARIQKANRQQVQMLGINLTDDYTAGEMESCSNITSDHFPNIATAAQPEIYDTSMIGTDYQPISMFAWESLFVVSDEPADDGGFKCFYGGRYCGNAKNTDLPKQYAVVNSKLVMWPDKVYFNLYDQEMESHDLTTAPQIVRVETGTIIYRKAAT